MLVLTRRLGETIVLNGEIEVTVVAIDSKRIRLGITAPPDVTVDRQEVYQRRAQFAEQEPAHKIV
jgi:carbon storage regulator